MNRVSDVMRLYIYIYLVKVFWGTIGTSVGTILSTFSSSQDLSILVYKHVRACLLTLLVTPTENTALQDFPDTA